jgi:hypothetical protein
LDLSYPEVLQKIARCRTLVFAFDNEPRNAALHVMMEKAIDDGHKIVIWPNIEMKGYK